MANLDSPELIAFANALAGKEISIADLSVALTKMLDNVTAHCGGDRRKARSLILKAMPSEPAHLRDVFKALLTPPPLDDVIYIKIYNLWMLQNPTATEEDFGRWWTEAPLRAVINYTTKGKKIGKFARVREPRSYAKRLKRALGK